eukprot:TRINITY_DN17376_c0_g2_i1.p1 TRINITY_DN17376_c0_g2~~TRINITY_DN17376_c0_g2_i1.p1  ORF type:complete len:204 (+),score=0.01 TRINITY_DN17376_c0_g2_i1:32-613(+)
MTHRAQELIKHLNTWARKAFHLHCSQRAKLSVTVTKPLAFIDLKYRSPGPCAYQSLSCINPKGNFVYSNYRGACCCHFNPPKSKRFFSSVVIKIAPLKSAVPGPGSYEHKSSFRGLYVPSNVRSTGNKRRTVDKLQDLPGPGTYKTLSDFEYYGRTVKNVSRNVFNIKKSLSLIHICRCRRYAVCRSRWSPYH